MSAASDIYTTSMYFHQIYDNVGVTPLRRRQATRHSHQANQSGKLADGSDDLSQFINPINDIIFNLFIFPVSVITTTPQLTTKTTKITTITVKCNKNDVYRCVSPQLDHIKFT